MPRTRQRPPLSLGGRAFRRETVRGPAKRGIRASRRPLLSRLSAAGRDGSHGDQTTAPGSARRTIGFAQERSPTDLGPAPATLPQSRTGGHVVRRHERHHGFCSGPPASSKSSPGGAAGAATMEEPTQTGHGELLVLGSTRSKQALGAGQIELSRGTRVQRRLASSVELSARAREVDVAPEMPVAYGEQRARDRSFASQRDRPGGAALRLQRSPTRARRVRAALTGKSQARISPGHRRKRARTSPRRRTESRLTAWHASALGENSRLLTSAGIGQSSRGWGSVSRLAASRTRRARADCGRHGSDPRIASRPAVPSP